MTKQAYRARVLAALPGTQLEIRAKTGISQAAVSRWLVNLCDCNEAHIGDWRPPENGGPVAAVYVPGPGADAVCRHKALTQKERDRRSRKARRKTGEWEDRLAAERARYWAAKPARRDPLVAAFFGPA